MTDPSTLAATATEQAVIAEARRQGRPAIEVRLVGTDHSLPMCGSCGRIVCHPDCPRGKAFQAAWKAS